MIDLPPDYVPVACELHSRYELAVLRRSTLELEWREDGGTHWERGRALDVQTRDGGEYLVVEGADGEPRWVRLDRIVRCSFP